MAPLLAYATILGGMFGDANAIAATYDWQAYISIVAGLLMFGVNVAFYRKNTSKVISNTLGMLGLLFLDYILFNLMQVAVYRLITSGSLFARGVKEVTENGTGKVVNVYLYGERGLVYNLFALVIMITGAFIFRSQGVVCNVRQKFIDDKRNAEFDRNDKNFSIDEVESEKLEELEGSSNSTNEETPRSTDSKGDETLNLVEKKDSSEDN